MKNLGAAVVLGLAIFATGGAVRAQGELDYTPRMPRPVDAEERMAMGYPAPRPTEIVLAAYDALAEPTRPDMPDEFTEEFGQILRAYRKALREYHMQRTDLTAEIEEGGYSGARFDELLEARVTSLTQIWQHAADRNTDWIFMEMMDVHARHPERRASDQAEWIRRSRVLRDMLFIGFAPRDEDIQRLADLELKFPYGEERAGALILRGLTAHGSGSEIHERWYAWMLENLPPESEGYKTAQAEAGIGQPLTLSGDTLDGSQIDTADWKGNVVVVDVWGIWCTPCIESMPELKRVYDKYRDRGLRVVGIFADWRPEHGKTFLEEHRYDWPQIVDPQVFKSKDYREHHIVEQLHVRGYPTVLIIDRDGNLRVRDYFPDLEAEVLQWLDMPVTGGGE